MKYENQTKNEKNEIMAYMNEIMKRKSNRNNVK